LEVDGETGSEEEGRKGRWRREDAGRVTDTEVWKWK
jgi:hypothetical protein